MDAGKVCVVTGASSGIGYAIAEALIRAGHIVYGLARRVDRMADLAELGGRPRGVDLTDAEATERVITEILAEHGQIDVMINNAGAGLYGAIEDVPLEAARQAFELNVIAAARLTQLVLPGMRRQRSGTIVMISSIGGVIALPLGGWYHATKHALEGLADSLRQEVVGFGVAVVVVEPGLIKSEFQDGTPEQLERHSGRGAYAAMARRMAAQVGPANGHEARFSDPSVVADAVLTAVSTSRPKPRYAVGHLARPLLALERLLPTRLFDKIVTPRE